MKKLAILTSAILFLSLSATSVYAYELISYVNIKRMRVEAQYVYFGTSTQPADTCNNWETYFRFDHTTAQGRAWLSTITAAKLADKSVTVWYNPSTDPNTSAATGGCSNDAVAQLVIIAVN